MDERLRIAYQNTTFSAETPFGLIRLRVGTANPLLAGLLEHFSADEWTFITAYNPRSQTLSDEENSQRQNVLERRLRQMGYKMFLGAGQGDDGEWPSEPSLLVLGIERTMAITTGREFGQNAIIVGGIDAVPQLVACG